MRPLLILILILTSTACGNTFHGIPGVQERHHDQWCKSLGIEEGTDAYVDCRMDLKLGREVQVEVK